MGCSRGIALHSSGYRRLPGLLRRWLRQEGIVTPVTAVTAVVAVDDGLMLHERLGLRVPGGEVVVLGSIVLFAVLLLIPSAGALLHHPSRPMLVAVVVLLGGSVVVDALDSGSSMAGQ